MNCLPPLDLLHVWDAVGMSIAQARPASPSVDPATVELLKDQLKFLQDANSRISGSVTLFLSVITACAVAFTAFGAWFFTRSLSGAKEEIDKLVKTEVNRQIRQKVAERITTLEQVLDREQIPANVSISYVTQKNIEPFGYRLLNSRFPRIARQSLSDHRPLTAAVIVLDLVDYQPQQAMTLTNPEVEEILQAIAPRIDPERSALVIYVYGQFDAIKGLSSKIKYSIPTNFTSSLIGNTVNAAYLEGV